MSARIVNTKLERLKPKASGFDKRKLTDNEYQSLVNEKLEGQEECPLC